MPEVPAEPKTLSCAWRNTCLLISCCLLIVVRLYWSTVMGIVGLWHTSTFSHGFLVVPISLYLIWLRRDRVLPRTPHPTAGALPLLALLGFGWLIGNLTTTDVLQQFCLVAMMVVLVWAILGTELAKTLIMPLTFLLFAVPLGASLIPTLQDFAAWFAVKMLDLSGVPVLLEGRFISVPSGMWEVAEACSGIRYLIASLAVGFLFAGLVYRTWLRRVAFFGASAVVPILANGLRVYGIVLLAYLTDNRIAAGVDHILYGWLFFTIVTALLLSVGFWWRERPQGQSECPPASSSILGDTHPHNSATAGLRADVIRTVLFATIGMLVVGFAPVSVELFGSKVGGTETLRPRLPQVTQPWVMVSADQYDWKPDFAAPSSEWIGSYVSGPRVVELYVAYYAPGQQSGKLVSSANLLFDRLHWLRTGEGETSANSAGGQSFPVHETFIRSQNDSLLVWNCYWIDGRFTDSDYLAKGLLAKSRLSRSPNASAAIAVATEDEPPGSHRAKAALKDFLSHLSP